MAPPFYRDAVTSGIWGYPTSTMDWCEENYAFTSGIAEFWNTISNVIFIIPPLVMIYRTHHLHILEHRTTFTLLLLTSVGFGSAAFHCTLLYESQLLDELPMVYGTCAMIYCIVELRGEANKVNVHLAVALSITCGVITLGYMLLKTPLFFLCSYGSLVAGLFLLHVQRYLRYGGSTNTLISSVASYTFGLLLWIIDNELCYEIRDVRSNATLFLKPVTQLHAWWHLFSGIGTFLCIMFSLDFRLCAKGYQTSLKWWMSIFVYGCIDKKMV